MWNQQLSYVASGKLPILGARLNIILDPQAKQFENDNSKHILLSRNETILWHWPLYFLKIDELVNS